MKIGHTITYVGTEWDVFDISGDGTYILGLHTIPFDVIFGTNTNYKTSYLRKVCQEYKKYLGCEEELFIPTAEEITSYGNKDWKAKNATGNYVSYWLSSRNDNHPDFVYSVYSDGTTSAYNCYFGRTGFRPFIKVRKEKSKLIMTKQQFIKSCANINKFATEMDKIEEVLRIDAYETPIGDAYSHMVDNLCIACGKENDSQFIEDLYLVYSDEAAEEVYDKYFS